MSIRGTLRLPKQLIDASQKTRPLSLITISRTSTTTGTCDTHECGHHLASLPGVPMKLSLVLAAVLSTASSAFALDGTVNIHDPSTVIESNGKWFTWGTGGGGLVSNDGWTWSAGRRGGVSGMAPDVIKV